ncbi:MAG: nucleotide exchange factor GrpE, partial [Actinobacteria bacterium]|nr:nucleotide exchange factor GrpE [Actinomycetota bacterium]
DLGDISADLSEMEDLLKSRGIDAEIIDAEADADAAVLEAVELAGRLEAERDEYLDLARRVQADFENYKRRVDQQNVELRARAAEQLARELLPVLDAGEAASVQGMQDAAAIYSQLLSTLEKQGLARVAESDVEFDPNIHEAVIHEEGESEGEAAVVTEILRTGYLWNDRVLRPAMVKVLG